MNCFKPADILLPQGVDLSRWAVVACDQYTSEPEYWARVDARTEGVPSSRHLILPEAELNAPDVAQKIEAINETMRRYLADGVFEELPHAYVYVERSLSGGQLRRGLVGMVDLERYDFSRGSQSAIRATEGTVLERIPPRKRVREHAPIELPHVLMLADDPADHLLAPLSQAKDGYRKLYDFDLMEQGGHITGWLVSPADAQAFDERLARYEAELPARYADLPGAPVLYAVGDGNHSLATAKTCYEEQKAARGGDGSGLPARWALVELENIHDPALQFEPIHRVVTATEPEKLLAALQAQACAPDGLPVRYVTAAGEGEVRLDKKLGELEVGILQNFLDAYLAEHPGQIDYIHGDEVTRRLGSASGAVGFLLPPMAKGSLFRGVVADGALPRKTFSMGHANEKRFYLEGRRIVEPVR